MRGNHARGSLAADVDFRPLGKNAPGEIPGVRTPKLLQEKRKEMRRRYIKRLMALGIQRNEAAELWMRYGRQLWPPRLALPGR